jgi:hypothetical protein
MRWAGHLVRTEQRIAHKLLVGRPEGNRPDHSEDLGEDGKLILEWI